MDKQKFEKKLVKFVAKTLNNENATDAQLAAATTIALRLMNGDCFRNPS